MLVALIDILAIEDLPTLSNSDDEEAWIVQIRQIPLNIVDGRA